jgi:hypothetical protein
MQGRRKYDINDNFFSDLTLENCYWGGMLASDGCIHAKSKVSLVLQGSDIEHVRKLAKCANIPTENIKVKKISYVKQNGENSTVAGLYITSRQWVEDLNFWFNITPNKTLTLQPPDIENKNDIVAFLAGFIDGDGYIKVQKRNNSTWLSLSITSANLKFLQWVNNFIENNYLDSKKKGVTGVPIKQKSKKHCYEYSFGGVKAVKFANDVLSLDLPLLNRKWDKVIEFLLTSDAKVKDSRTQLDDEKVKEIRKLIYFGTCDKDICKKFNIAQKTLDKIRLKTTWKQIDDGLGKLSKKYHKNQANEIKVKMIKILLNKGWRNVEISRKLKVSTSTVAKIKSGKCFSHVKI